MVGEGEGERKGEGIDLIQRSMVGNRENVRETLLTTKSLAQISVEVQSLFPLLDSD